MPTLRAWLLTGFSFWLLVGCSSSQSPVQVVDRNSGSAYAKKSQPSGGRYIVQRGDTLYSIAFRFGWDWKALASKNNIAAPYVIKPGQIVHFGNAPAAVSTTVQTYTPATQPVAPAASSQRAYTVPPARTQVPLTVPATTSKSVESTPAASAVTPLSSPAKLSSSGWAWPAQGVVIGRFSSNGSLNKGIDIAGELGQPVLAAQDGTVVYAGSGLRGYGELVIIKHSDVYVSAYGHNRKLLVREGQKVKAGQVIAEMGSTGTDRVKLHFEIRRQGKPVDPLQYLPSR